MFETGVVRANECYSLFQVSRYNRNIISISFDIKVYYVLSLELPHFGDSQKYKQHTIINIKKENHPIISYIQNFCSCGFFATD